MAHDCDHTHGHEPSHSGHSHSHAHVHGSGPVLWWSLAGTIAFIAIEAFAGVQASSLALLSDAGHNFADAFAIGLAIVAVYFAKLPADEHKTFGYQRAGVLAAFVNAVALLILAAWLMWESVDRFRHPQPVSEKAMLIVSFLGLLLNGAIMLGLRHAKDHDLNIRAAFLHMLGDALGSAAIMIGAVAIHFTGWQWIDPALSILIAGLIVWSGWGIVRDSLNVLLEGVPKGLGTKRIAASIRAVDGVFDVHDIHVWTLGAQAHALSAHVLIEDMPPSESGVILKRVNQMLCDRFKLHHTTLQFEHVNCHVHVDGCTLQVTHPHEH